MIAIGKNINGEEKEFHNGGSELICSFNKLIELNINEKIGLTHIKVFCNKLTKLTIPNSVKYVYCFDNQLTELNLPDSVEKVFCFENPIKEITLPKKIRVATLPLNCNVLNIDEFKNRDDVEIFFFSY